MNCNYCSAQFDHVAHVPRLLIFCGHSLCQFCCHKLHNNSRIQCPECMSNTFIEQVNFLPKNLALLKVNNNMIPSSSNSYCLKHEKKYEAFCKKQKVLICVDCILHDSHRNHEMDSIKNAYSDQQAILAQSIAHIESLLKLNKARYQENLQNQKLQFQNYQTCNHNLANQFQQLRQIIEREQQNIIQKVKDQHTQSQAKFQERNSKYKQSIEELSISLAYLQQQTKLSEIQFLANVSLRQQIKSSINNSVQENQKILNFVQNKNVIVESIIKSIQKNFKACSNTNPLNQPNSHKNTPQNMAKQKKNTTQHSQIQSIKTLDSQQIASMSQNQKPMAKKVVSKKQPVPANYAGNSVASSVIVSKNNQPLTKSCTNVQQQKKASHSQKQKMNDKFDIAKNCDVSIVQQKQSLFNSFFSNMTSFLTQQKFIYVIGGFDQQSSSIIRLNLSNYKWQQVSSLKAPRSKFGCVAVEKNIFILGGKKGRQRVADVEVWNNGNWKTSITLKKKRSGFGVISIDHLIYIIGGNDGQNILSTVDILDAQTGEWSRGEPMLQARDELAVCMGKDNKIYAIGGFGGKNNEPLKSVEVFDLQTSKWHKAPSMSTPRRALAAAALADGVYAIGGFDGTKHLDTVQKFQQDSLEWVKLASLKRGRCTHSAVSIFDTQQIVVIGGFDQESLDSVQKYSLISNQWEELPKMPSPRFMHASVLLSE